jgi:uncharacterized protein with GYD domain
MSLNMLQGTMTSDALAALTRNPQNRAEPQRLLCQKLGGRLVDFYYRFGDYDAVALVEAPDDVTMTAIVLATISPGHIKSTRTTRLIPVDEAMEAMEKAGSVTYAAPDASPAGAC